MPSMSTVTKTWLAFAALGTGMIHLALVISSPLPIAVALGFFGAIEVGWGLVTLAGDRIRMPRLVLLGSLLPVLFWALVVGASAAFGGPSLTSIVGLTALAAATALEVFAAVTLAVHVRRGTDFSVAAKTPPAGRYLAGLLVGGIVVAALTTPALAATEAGLYAQPHGEHSDEFQPRTSEGSPAFELPLHSGH